MISDRTSILRILILAATGSISLLLSVAYTQVSISGPQKIQEHTIRKDDHRNNIHSDSFQVAVMNYNDLLSIQKLQKLELGIQLTKQLQEKIDNFTEKADTPSSEQINPYLEWEIRVVAFFSKDGMTEPIETDGFYTRDFEVWQQNPLPTPNNWRIGYTNEEYQSLGGWTDLHSPYTFRIRFAPPQSGLWRSIVKVFVSDSLAYESPEWHFNVEENHQEGYVSAGKRFMLRDGKTFFPVGINLPWPETHEKFDPELSDNMETTDTWSSPGDTIRYRGTEGYSHNYCVPRVYDSYRSLMTRLAAGGANYMRMIMNPISTDIEYEELGNYTDRLHMAYELDKILEHAEELGLFIHWNMSIHYTFQMKGITSYYRWWTWDDTVRGRPFAYAALVGPDPVGFLSHAEAKKYYKQHYRYILARWGYSQNIAVLELFSEISNIGSEAPDKSFFYQSGDNWTKYRDWQVEMAAYIKSQYHGRIHALTSSYAGKKVPADDTFDSPYFDLMTVNIYDFTKPGFADELIKVTAQSIFNDQHEDSYTKNTIKPIMFSETDAIDASCDDNYVEIIRSQWQRLFSGLAGSFSWMMMYKPELFPVLGQMRQAISSIELEGEKWHPGASELMESPRGPEWIYKKDYVRGMDGNMRSPFSLKQLPKKADAMYLRSGNREYAAGVVSNKTYNIYNQGNDCFKNWWKNICTHCPSNYDIPAGLEKSLFLTVRESGLSFRNMQPGRYDIHQLIPAYQFLPVTYKSKSGTRLNLSGFLGNSLIDYIQIIRVNPVNDDKLMNYE